MEHHPDLGAGLKLARGQLVEDVADAGRQERTTAHAAGTLDPTDRSLELAPPSAHPRVVAHPLAGDEGSRARYRPPMELELDPSLSALGQPSPAALAGTSFPPAYLESARLRLRPPTLADAPAMFESWCRHESVTHHLTCRSHRYVATTESFVRSAQDAWEFDQGVRVWVLERRARAEGGASAEEEALVGTLSARLEWPFAEVGYVLGPAHHGQGYMSEALAVLSESALTLPARRLTLPTPGQPAPPPRPLARLQALVDPENLASQRVLERCGYVREGRLRRYMVQPNRGEDARDMLLFARTA